MVSGMDASHVVDGALLGRAVARRLGYDRKLLNTVPAGALESFAGVGHIFDLAGLREGETVVDLGSGSGADLFAAAVEVGEHGHVTGIVTTDAHLAKAARLAAEHGFANVDLFASRLEATPLAGESADVVISNGVINLCPDKAAAFGEVARLLRPGGRAAIADIVGGSDYLDGLAEAGLRVDVVRENRGKYGVISVSLLARKPG